MELLSSCTPLMSAKPYVTPKSKITKAKNNNITTKYTMNRLYATRRGYKRGSLINLTRLCRRSHEISSSDGTCCSVVGWNINEQQL